MAQQENSIPLSKKGQREVSPFIGHELLYDYLCGTLDEERKKAVADHVKFSRDAQLDLAKIENGQSYAEKLSETKVSEAIIEQINTPSTYLTVLMQKSKFEKWPQGLKWGLEALVVVLVIVSLLTLAPWEKVLRLGISSGPKEVVLAEVTKNEQPAAPEKLETPQFADEDLKAKTDKAGKKDGKSADAKAAAATAVATTPAAASAKAAKAVAVAKNEEADSSDDAEPSASPAVTGGFLYRGSISVTNIAVVGPKITDKILELGGRKAGAVELGWQKTENSMYYHFTIPEAKYQELLDYLATYGKPRIGKEKHPRVMPDGILRLIVTVDEADQ